MSNKNYIELVTIRFAANGLFLFFVKDMKDISLCAHVCSRKKKRGKEYLRELEINSIRIVPNSSSGRVVIQRNIFHKEALL